MSTKTLTTWTIGVVALASAGPLPAHHSLAQFDLTTPIWLQGIVVGFERINPHSIVIGCRMTGRYSDGPWPAPTYANSIEGVSVRIFCKRVTSSSSAALR